MLAMYVIEPAQTGWAAPIVFTPDEDGTLLFRMGYCKLHIVAIHIYPILPMYECIAPLADATISRHWTLITATGR